MFRIACFFSGLVLLSATALAIDYDESIDGDLSTDPLSPTMISPTLGLNTVIGSVADPDDTRDYFTFNVAPGHRLAGIFLLDYTDLATGGPGNTGFIHIDDGTTSVIPGVMTASDFLGGSHLDRLIFPSPTDNVLQVLAGAPQGGVGFMAPLGPGDYTVNVQQTGADLTGYSLGLEIVAEPTASVWLIGLPLLLLACRPRR